MLCRPWDRALRGSRYLRSRHDGRDDELSQSLSRKQGRQRLRASLEWVAPGHMRPQAAFAKPPEESLEIGCPGGGLGFDVAAPENADQRAALEQGEVGRHPRDVAIGKADDEVPPAPRTVAQRRLRER